MLAGEDIAWLKQRLGARICEVPVQGDRPLVLDDPSCAYVTLSEHHHLFCVGYRDGLPYGRREHVTRCPAGQLLFGVEPSGSEAASALLLSGFTGSVVWRFPAAALYALEGLGDRTRGAHLIESWLSLLSSALPASGRPAAPRSQELLASRDRADVAVSFAADVLEVAGRRRAELAEERLRRGDRRQAEERAELDASLRELALVGRGRRLVHTQAASDAFARACGCIFERLGVSPQPHVVQPRSTALADLRDALRQTTGVRTRAVLLEPEFWRNDAGPLLAFYEEGLQHRPVALLPRGRGYELYDPSDGELRPLDAALSARLHPRAYQFYRTLPQQALGVLRLVAFAIAGMRRDMCVVALIGLCSGLVNASLPMLHTQLFDRIIPGVERGLLQQILLMLLGVYAGMFLFDATRGLALLRVQTRLDASVEGAVWDRLLRLPLPFFRQYSAGDLAARVYGIGSVRRVLSEVALSSLLAAVFSVGNIGLLFVLDVELALTVAGLVAIVVLVGAVAAIFELRQRRRISTLDGRIRGLLLQLFSGISKLRVSGSENRAFSVWARLFTRRRDANLAGEHVVLGYSVFQVSYQIICSLVLYALVTSNLERLTTGQFLAFNAAFSAVMRAVLDLVNAGLQALQVVPLYERARPILTSPLESQEQGGTTVELTGGIELSHVSFRYAASGPLVLDDVSLQIAPGEFVAIVGGSGSGKSTLVRMLLGFDTPTEGGVYYDGQVLTGLDMRAVRQQIGVVLQHSQVMPGDIYSNIVGSTGLSIEHAWRAARQAALDKDIEAMAMGMHTIITAGGGTLSGGQRQRLMIARALASQPKILLLDEATSALDNHNQALVSASLDALRVTRIVVAHRLSTVKNADRIIVLEHGRIVQMGNYESLIEQGQTFARLVQRQLV